MSISEPKLIQVHTRNLAGFCHALSQAIGKEGFSGNDITKVFAQYLTAECVLCGVRLAGDELGTLAAAASDSPAPTAKLDRLRLGYCARDGCKSTYYDFKFGEHPGLDWDQVLQRAGTVSKPEEELPPDAAPAPAAVLVKSTRWIRVLAVLGFLLVTFLCWYFYRGGTLAGLVHKHHKYSVDPSSITAEKSAEPTGPGK